MVLNVRKYWNCKVLGGVLQLCPRLSVLLQDMKTSLLLSSELAFSCQSVRFLRGCRLEDGREVSDYFSLPAMHVARVLRGA